MDKIVSFVENHWPWLLGGIGLFLIYEYYSSSSSSSASAPATAAQVLTGENSALAAANESSADAGTVAQMNYQLGMAQAQAPVQEAEINANAATTIAQTNATASEYNLTTAAELDAALVVHADEIVHVERGFAEWLFWSIEIAGESPSISSTSGLSRRPKNCRA